MQVLHTVGCLGQGSSETLCAFQSWHTAAAAWEHLEADAISNWEGEAMEGTAPRTKMEKQVLKDLHERGVIDDPKLGDFIGLSA